MIADQYEVKGVLGEGGTGIVYDAVRTSDNAAVALKVMHASLAGDQQIRGRFQREAAILRRLEGDHVCKVLDFGETAGEEPDTTLLYIAMPKIHGQALSTLIAKAPLPVDRALDIMLEILAALASAHAQGIIHRDLKPANVLIDVDGKVIVADFGMSKIITGTGAGTTNLTAHNMLFGTPEYMSPEQARGDDLDARCDVYAAGVMLYELLSGTPPFTGETPLGVLTAHLTADITPPSQTPGGRGRVTPALEAVTMHALERDPNRRYASAAALAAAITQARLAPTAGHAFAATVPSQPPPIIEVDPTAPTLLGDAAIPREALPSRSPPARISLKPPPPEPKSSKTMWIALYVAVIVLSIGVGALLALRH